MEKEEVKEEVKKEEAKEEIKKEEVPEVKPEKKERSTKSKVITILLGISLFCMFSLLLMLIFGKI